MARLKPEQLEASLARGLAPLYAVHGDEPLLMLEAAEAVRARAREAGYTERVVLAAERGLRSPELAAASASLSLFGARRLIELRLASQPDAETAQAIEAYCRSLPPETVTLVTLPRLDRAAQSSDWFRSLERVGVTVAVATIERARLAEWIAGRLARQNQRAEPQALEFLADCVEGNLLAAHQEIAKLALLAPAGALDLQTVRRAVLNVARYDAAQLPEAMLAGDRARFARMLAGLRGEGEAPPRLLWLLAGEIRALCRIQRALAAGRPSADACREARVWGESHQRLALRAARCLAREALYAALAHAAYIDRIAKGVAEGDAWDELLRLGLRFAGLSARANDVARPAGVESPP